MKTKIWIVIILTAIVAGAFWVDDTWEFPFDFPTDKEYTYVFKVDTITAFEGSKRLRYTVERSDGKQWFTEETVGIVGRTSGYNIHVTQRNVRDFKCDITSDCEFDIKENGVWTLTEKTWVYSIKTDFLKEKYALGPRFIIRCVAYDVEFTDPETGKTFTSKNDIQLKATTNCVENFYRPDMGFDKYLGTYVLKLVATFNDKPFYHLSTESDIYL